MSVFTPDEVARFQAQLDAQGLDAPRQWAIAREERRTRAAEGRSRMASCPLRSWDRGPGLCDGCGAALAGRKRRWCSEECGDRWWANHAWTSARWEAIRRSSGFSADQLRELGQALYSMAFCDECGDYTGAPEVNHVEPRNGGGYGPGCHHHQTNLQVLCHDCHVAETTRQVRERRGIPAEGRPAPQRPPTPEPGIPIWDFAS